MIIPIIEIADKIETLKKAKVIPTAKASILVAIDNIIKSPIRKVSSTHSISSSSASLIILIPINPNNIKAIQ